MQDIGQNTLHEED